MGTWTIVLTNWRRLGLKAVMEKAVIWAEDFWFDFRYGTDTLRREKTVDPAVTSPNAANALHYAPARSRYFRALMGRMVFPQGSVLVDVGCGKGKVVMMAMDYPFKKVVGIDFSDRLCKIARNNIATYCAKTTRTNTTEIHVCDAADYAIAPEQNVFFLYDPFKEAVMQKFIGNLTESLERSPRCVWLIYYEPIAECRDVIESKGRFVLSHQVHYLDKKGLIYERPA